MAEVTVNQLAETVGTPVDKLLAQMKEAGLSHSSGAQKVSDEDKQTLLTFLQSSHGGESEEPRKITLKRKTVSTLKSATSQGKKTVSVEVRKKRTFVKRTPEELQEEAEQQAKADAEAAALLAEQQAKEKIRIEALAEEERIREAAERKAQEEAEIRRAEKAALEAKSRLNPNDPEVMRQLAAARRKEQELLEIQERDNLLKAKAKAKADAEAEIEAIAKRKLEEAEEKKRKDSEADKKAKAKPSPAGKPVAKPVASEADIEAAELAKKKRIKDLPKKTMKKQTKSLKLKA